MDETLVSMSRQSDGNTASDGRVAADRLPDTNASRQSVTGGQEIKALDSQTLTKSHTCSAEFRQIRGIKLSLQESQSVAPLYDQHWMKHTTLHEVYQEDTVRQTHPRPDINRMTVEASVTARQDQIVLTDSTPKPRIRFAEPDKIWPECSGSTDELDAPDLDRVDKVTIWLESFGQHSRFEDPELANSACTHSGSDSQLLAYRSTGDEKYRPPPPLKGILRDRRALTSQDQLCHLITTQIVAPATAAVDYLISLIYW